MVLKDFVKKNYRQIEMYTSILKEEDWTIMPEPSEKQKEKLSNFYKSDLLSKASSFEHYNNLCESILNRLKFFLKTYDGERKKKDFEKFLIVCLEGLEAHLERSEDYVSNQSVNFLKDKTISKTYLEVTDEIFSKTSKIRETMSGLNLSISDEETSIELIKDNYCPLIMHEIVINKYPFVKVKLDEMGIDFKAKPKPFMHIDNPNKPVWDMNKHYFDQEPDVLQYYVNERNKIKNGIVIDGQYISGWMYFQYNYFVAKYPEPFQNEDTGLIESRDVIAVPPIRDNEWWIINDNYEVAKKESKNLFIAATRRGAKTTMNASHLGYCMIAGKRNLIIASGSRKDLGQLQDAFEILQGNINPAFRVYNLLNDWEKEVTYGFKYKNQKSEKTAVIKIINLDGGADKKSEILAGFTPDAVIIDEIMKIAFKSQLDSILPAVDAPYGKRCVVIMTGTAGNEELAKDAFDVLRDPDSRDILNMNWELFNSRVPEELRTWNDRKFGTFIPAQMSAKEGMIKLESNLADFLNVKGEKLSKVRIKITDWEHAKNKIQEDRNKKANDIEGHIKEVLYYPFSPDDMMLSGKINPFPVTEAKLHLEYLKSIGGEGKKVFLQENNRKEITYSLSNDELAIYPHKGGFIDAPIVLYEDLPEQMPPDYLYVAGFDDYKQEQSSTDSVGAFHIYKVDYSNEDLYSGTIVASIATRPDPHSKLHYQIYLLQRAFNAICFMENADSDYETYLKTLRVDHIWLKTAIEFRGDMSVESKGRRTYGWNPSDKKTKDFLFSLLVKYTKTSREIQDEDGSIRKLIGVQRINDIGVLEEIVAYKDGNNVDRLTSFMSCLGLEFYLYQHKMFPDISRQLKILRDRRTDEIKKQTKKGSPFFNSKRTKKYF